MAERVTREQVLSVRCPKCGIRAGKMCGEQWTWSKRTKPHRERRQAFLDKQAGEAREGRE